MIIALYLILFVLVIIAAEFAILLWSARSGGKVILQLPKKRYDDLTADKQIGRTTGDNMIKL